MTFIYKFEKGHITFELTVKNDKIIKAAPTAKWTKGKQILDVIRCDRYIDCVVTKTIKRRPV